MGLTLADFLSAAWHQEVECQPYGAEANIPLRGEDKGASGIPRMERESTWRTFFLKQQTRSQSEICLHLYANLKLRFSKQSLLLPLAPQATVISSAGR